MKRPRFTAQQIKLCANDEAAARVCVAEERFGAGAKKRPPAEYWEILKKRAAGISYRIIGREHGDVTPPMASVLVFRAFVLQEQGLLDRDAWDTPGEKAGDLTVRSWLKCCQHSNYNCGEIIADLRSDRDLPQFSGPGEMLAYLRRRGTSDDMYEVRTVWARYRSWRARHTRHRRG